MDYSDDDTTSGVGSSDTETDSDTLSPISDYDDDDDVSMDELDSEDDSNSLSEDDSNCLSEDDSNCLSTHLLYEINDDPKRKEFLDDLFSFMQKRGTPINRLPIMAKSVLDLYELYNLVIARGGLVDVINKKLWQEIIKGLHLPSSITSAAFTLRTQYMKYLYPYECEKKNLSSPAELQAAIDGNRREGRRSSYGQFEAMHNQLQLPQLARQTLPSAMQQMSPLALVTHAAANNQQAQAAAAAAAAHQRLMGQMPGFGQDFEQRMVEYLKLMHIKKDPATISALQAQQHLQQQQQQQQELQQQLQEQKQRQRSPSPREALNLPDSPTHLNTGHSLSMQRDAVNALEMSRLALWQMYHNNTSPPASVNTSPQQALSAATGAVSKIEPQREALNLSDLPTNLNSGNSFSIKRERVSTPPQSNDHDDFQHLPPPNKRGVGATAMMPPGFPQQFYLPPVMTGSHFNNYKMHHNDGDDDDGDADDDDEAEGMHAHNSSQRNSPHSNLNELPLNGLMALQQHQQKIQQLNLMKQQQQQQQQLFEQQSSLHLQNQLDQHQHEKSDDSAIDSPSRSAGNGALSPVSTKKLHHSKQKQSPQFSPTSHAADKSSSDNSAMELNLFSGLQLRVIKNGTNSNGQEELFINLELNGIKYTGLVTGNAADAAVAGSRNKLQPSESEEEHDAEPSADAEVSRLKVKGETLLAMHKANSDVSKLEKADKMEMDCITDTPKLLASAEERNMNISGNIAPLALAAELMSKSEAMANSELEHISETPTSAAALQLVNGAAALFKETLASST